MRKYNVQTFRQHPYAFTLEFRINSSLSLFAATPFGNLRSLKLSNSPSPCPSPLPLSRLLESTSENLLDLRGVPAASVGEAVTLVSPASSTSIIVRGVTLVFCNAAGRDNRLILLAMPSRLTLREEEAGEEAKECVEGLEQVWNPLIPRV